MSGDEHFLSRWSRMKREARSAPPESAPAEPAQPPAQAGTATVAAVQTPAEPAPLPPVETLTPQSDFTGFMKPEVDPALRRQALKALFQDPQFNVMDGLDVYIDDYTKADPLPEGWLEKMSQVARLGAYEPPKEEEPVPAESHAEERAEAPPPDAAQDAAGQAARDSGESPQSETG